jgi:hypothetical protein
MLWDESADELVLSGTMKIKEQADADADTAGFGQLWVNTATPNELYFTNDAGTDQALASTGKSIVRLSTCFLKGVKLFGKYSSSKGKSLEEKSEWPVSLMNLA